MGKVTKVKEEGGRGGGKGERDARGEQMRRANTDRRGTEEGERGPFVRFSIPSFLAYRSRGPGRTILLDLCALVRLLVPHGAPPLPKATSAGATMFLFAKIVQCADIPFSLSFFISFFFFSPTEV